ncbi:MAG: hypothetical protein LGL72_01915 [Acidibrevibacterium sp.]|uniref:hypothetical protein n=1 Tax=Acidibrevibacterium fodinaquatile TaxID=1969806 RepID=UPI0023A842ED|nr:hypothetical protein [Acidibrevibacterium fodinaquatile]MCA7118180.1 hypothetical protein [Acidibrevibacterium fodinaquatile]
MTGIRDLSRRLATLDLEARKRSLLARAAARLAEAARARAGDAIPLSSASDSTQAVVAAGGDAAAMREFGTHRVRPRPFLAPAATDLAPEIAADIAREIADEITSAIAELP